MPRGYAMESCEKREQYRGASGARQIRTSVSCGDNQFAVEHWKMLNQVGVLFDRLGDSWI
jgi:hypothetical protein